MNIEIANRLIELRKKNGLSQEQLAEKLGLSRQAVSKWERAEASPDTDNLICLAKIYGVSLDDLLNTDQSIDELLKETKEENEEKEKVEAEVVETKTKTEAKKKKDNKSKQIESVITWSLYLVYTIVYVTLGCIYPELWSLMWPGFLLPLVFSTLVRAIMDKSPNAFAYPLLVAGVYCFIGMLTGFWHPTWIIFLTIPLYYAVISLINKIKDND